MKVANQIANVQLQAPQWGTVLTAQAGFIAPHGGEFHLQTQNLAIDSLPVALPQVLQQGGLAGTVSLDVQGRTGRWESPRNSTSRHGSRN